jgi:hypothetical protein
MRNCLLATETQGDESHLTDLTFLTHSLSRLNTALLITDFLPRHSAGLGFGKMRTSCVQNAPKNANITFLLLLYQPLTTFTP